MEKLFCGTSSYVTSEILYRAKMNPTMMVRKMSPEQLKHLYDTTVQILTELRQSRGLTIRDFWPPSGKRGSYQPHIFQQERDPLGNEVRTDNFADKKWLMTYYVPEVQK